jgi:hypothetical protein
MNPALLDWCPDSKCLIVTDTSGEGKPDVLFVVDTETGDKRPLTQPSHLFLQTRIRRCRPTAVRCSSSAERPGLSGTCLLPLAAAVTAARDVRRLAFAHMNPDV